ncbi:MAG: hypothetical protein ACREIA_23820 [Opitutaceae bacterium]
MKRFARSIFPSFLALSAVVSAASAVDAEKVRPAVPADQTLQVVLHDQSLPDRQEAWTQDSFSMDRESAFIAAFKAAWKEAGVKNALEFERFAAGVDVKPPSLRVTLQRWSTTPPRSGPSVSFDMLIAAELRLADREIELGNFSAQESHLPMGRRLDADDFQKVADQVVGDLVKALTEAVKFETGAAD